MSTKDYSAELLKMEGVQIEKLDKTEEEIILQISMERKMHICKRCGGETDRIHDYRVREVRDLELRGKPVRLLYRRRRYACPACGKRFSETNDFVGRYMRFTHRTAEKIMELLRRRSSMKDIAKDTGTSVSGVKRVLGIMPVSRPQRLPQALSFDEFKGDTGGQPFQCIVADPLNRRVFDILPDRTALTIQEYLCPFPGEGQSQTPPHLRRKRRKKRGGRPRPSPLIVDKPLVCQRICPTACLRTVSPTAAQCSGAAHCVCSRLQPLRGLQRPAVGAGMHFFRKRKRLLCKKCQK